MAEEEKKPVIIKRVIKKGGHGHHGGAWKIAYADFVTAMMAFFLMMWLLGAATEEQLAGIAEYFSPSSASDSTSGAGGMLGGKVLGQGALGSGATSISMSMPTPSTGEENERMTEEEFYKKMVEEEERQLEEARMGIQATLQSDEELAGLSSNLVIDMTPEGLRIQLIDQENTAMFPIGSSVMNPTGRKLIRAVSEVIKKIPQHIAIEGNTDAVPYINPDSGYGNWELSAARALSSRRELIAQGVAKNRISRVSGKAATDLFDADNPKSPTNRRISIIMLRNYKANQPAAGTPPMQQKRTRPRNPFVRNQP